MSIPSIKTKIFNSPLWIWVLLPSILMVLAWEPVGITPLLFIAFVPFWVIYDRLREGSSWRLFGVLYLAIFGWNLSTTWWVYYASAAGSVAMLILNTLFMCLPFLILRKIQKHKPLNFAFFAIFSLLWLLYEYGHHRWDLSWPWLALGNGFSATPWMVQWYEFTGTLGGSAWVIWVNIGIFVALKATKSTKFYFVLAASVALPMLISIVWGLQVNIQNGKPINVAVLQPSFNPWNEKFDRDPIDMQEEMQDLSIKAIDSTVDWLLWPETCLVRSIDVDRLDRDPQVLMLYRDILARYPKLQVLTGFHGVKYYDTPSKPTRSARKSQYDSRYFYDVYNSALWLQNSSLPRYYNKSKLVPGTEQMPFIHTIPFLESLAITLDENTITGSLGVSDSAYSLGEGTPVAPIICYESIYGDYVRGYLQRGAQWLGIVTNDAWWNETPGHKQHYSYARLRAIEFRKWVARSANTGTSGFIDPLGNSYLETSWYAKTCPRITIYANTYKTVYYHIGDLGFLGIYLTLVLLVNMFGQKFRIRRA